MKNRQAYALVLTGIICMGAIYAVPGQQAFAHEFSEDESASFLALIESIRVELGLVQSNFVSNVTLAEQHAEHAHKHLDEHTIKEISERNKRLGTALPAALEELHDSIGNSTTEQVQADIQEINNLLAETITVRISNEQLSNSTVWALVVANMADAVLEHYGAAYGMETEEGGGGHGHDEEESDNMTETTTTEDNNMTHGTREEAGGSMSMGEGNDAIVNVVHYQTSQGLAARTQVLFNEQVKNMAPANATQAVADLEAGLDHLIQAINNKELFADVEVIVHSEVHPHLQTAFNLQVIPEFPLPMLLIIPAIAGIIAATRFNALRRR